MNQLIITDPRINNGVKMSVFVPGPKAIIEDQISEIFIGEHYKSGRIKKDMIVIDCVANVGMASFYLKDWAKVIYALEPNPKNFECLVENTKQYPNIKPFCFGLSAKTNIEEMRNSEGYPIAESLFASGDVIERVKMIAIDEFMDEQKIDHVDLLKMDTEGSEYIIFPSNGFSKVAPRIDYIVGESHYVPPNLTPDYITPILEDMGFDTKFLPIDNYYLTMSFDDVIKREYKIKKQTMFFAKRKDLPWPS